MVHDDPKSIVATLAQLRPDEKTVPFPERIVLRVRSGPAAGKAFTLDGDVVVGGREEDDNPGVGVRLADASVSRKHFKLVRNEDGLFLHDLGSTNGTWLGGKVSGIQIPAFHGTVKLVLGARFWVGDSELELAEVETSDHTVSEATRLGPIFGQSLPMRHLFAKIVRMADTPFAVLLTGESGTGKELVARTLHDLSRRTGPFVAVNCALITEQLAEDKIMGHVKGAFSGAIGSAPGMFEEADGGTLFLDEIGELRTELQAIFLRVLVDSLVKDVTRIGEHRVRKVNVRIIAATHRNLQLEVDEGRFQQPLLERLSQLTLHLPPLRERSGDISFLAQHFVERFSQECGRPTMLSSDALEALERQYWPGNLRSLQNVIRRAVVLGPGGEITAADLELRTNEWATSPATRPGATNLLEKPLKERAVDLEREYCLAVMAEYDHQVRKAAEHAGYSEQHFRTLLRTHGIPAGRHAKGAS